MSVGKDPLQEYPFITIVYEWGCTPHSLYTSMRYHWSALDARRVGEEIQDVYVAAKSARGVERFFHAAAIARVPRDVVRRRIIYEGGIY